MKVTTPKEQNIIGFNLSRKCGVVHGRDAKNSKRLVDMHVTGDWWLTLGSLAPKIIEWWRDKALSSARVALMNQMKPK